LRKQTDQEAFERTPVRETELMLKKIPVNELREGMYLQGLCGPWMQHPFWRSKFIVKGADIQLIAESGITEVMIDSDKGLDVEPAPAREPIGEAEVAVEAVRAQAMQAANAARAVPKAAALSEELERARRICDTSRRAVAAMLQEARMGRAISREVAGALVEDIANSVMRNPGALISLARLKTADDYTYMHSVAVCALMVALARQLGLDEQQARVAGKAGLLHDMGKALVPLEVLNKPGKLTDEEFALVRQHPKLGYDLLLQGGNASETTLDVCLHHHEKVDGTGYPERLKGDDISLFSKMGAVCDVYDAITSDRPYKAGWDPAESIRRMTEWSEGHFDKRVFQAFVKSIGIYPTGSLLRLTSGRLAVVVEQSRASLLKPVVRAFFSTKSCVYVTPELIDLSRSGQSEKIAGAEDPAAWGLKDIERFWMA
jgi:putative nucleotidyltransferase with HDIG domain